MPGDRMLGTLLRALQTYTEQEDTPRLFGTAASLLTTLNNPLNVTLLTSQILSAPAIWSRPSGLQTCMRTLSVFHSAAQALLKHELALLSNSPDEEYPGKLQPERTLPKDDWIRAAVSGADEHSPRWRHLLAIGGMLLGFGPAEDEGLNRSMRATLEGALITAANLALEETLDDDELGLATITLVLNHCFPVLSDRERARLEYDSLLPVLMRSTLHSMYGLRSGYFLGALDRDVKLESDRRLKWSERSASYGQIKEMLGSPLVTSLGPLSRLIGHTVEQVRESWLVTSAVDDLEKFAQTLLLQWRQNKLSGIEQSEQKTQLDETTFRKTLPDLWKLLQPIMFASVIILRSAIGRVLGDAYLASDKVAPHLATQSLLILRSLYFITTHRSATSTFSQYSFVNYTALDILSAYPLLLPSFLATIAPATLGQASTHPLDRTLDLFFLNTAEHFTLLLPPTPTASLLVPTITAYLSAGGRGPLLPVFEAAHSVTLAIFSAPQNATATIENLPFYVDSLFRVFPASLSPRQFRLAFKTLLKLTSPPSDLAVSQPMMPAILLDLLRHRAANASMEPLPPHPDSPEEATDAPLLSEKAHLTVTILSTLSQLPLPLLREHLPLVADMINDIPDARMREVVVKEFWGVLVGGELDPERSRVCHGWWSTGGGKEWVLYGRVPDGEGEGVQGEWEMSGGLGSDEDDEDEAQRAGSKL
ncbi:uncharacterized protein MYCGRDRAFT_39123 [Zymoseptoria tritici IPO323]|uniref:Peroxisomal membrane protein Pex17 n=1 Tax=Zymoseptoria tritici (strain CBS 115943 / IPO323) TaxID=336722 RepID=F9X6F7_ZYMTI|nr:uncharacterized protein MYCGRDRAFT_39123 [Zymoseptoria tritici IPO323]EGP89205.1 hypothetical protein MYCGRDRAFT_39123 [Zymoseptoria tritici IPO323]